MSSRKQEILGRDLVDTPQMPGLDRVKFSKKGRYLGVWNHRVIWIHLQKQNLAILISLADIRNIEKNLEASYSVSFSTIFVKQLILIKNVFSTDLLDAVDIKKKLLKMVSTFSKELKVLVLNSCRELILFCNIHYNYWSLLCQVLL